MNQKTVAFKKLPPAARTAESWIDGNQAATAAPAAAMTRLTLDLPADLHRRIKIRSAEQGMRMAEILRTLIEREFPA